MGSQIANLEGVKGLSRGLARALRRSGRLGPAHWSTLNPSAIAERPLPWPARWPLCPPCPVCCAACRYREYLTSAGSATAGRHLGMTDMCGEWHSDRTPGPPFHSPGCVVFATGKASAWLALQWLSNSWRALALGGLWLVRVVTVSGLQASKQEGRSMSGYRSGYRSVIRESARSRLRHDSRYSPSQSGRHSACR